MVFDEAVLAVTPAMLETSDAVANFETKEEERLATIMSRDPTKNMQLFRLTRPNLLLSN